MVVEKFNIALPPEMADTLSEAVKSGEYASSSKVVNAGSQFNRLQKKSDISKIDKRIQAWVQLWERLCKGA